jgi:nicotinamidase-related amidase
MSADSPDLHQNAPDNAGVALIIIDMINDLEFPGGENLLGPALNAAKAIASLKAQSQRAGIPVIYANDNFGRWRSDFREVVTRCMTSNVRGKNLAQILEPDETDYFVLKPKHSAFYATALELLLRHLGCRHLILTGISGNMCVQFTACDAYMREFHLYVPRDCTASVSSSANQQSLDYIAETLKVDTRPSSALDLDELLAIKRDR